MRLATLIQAHPARAALIARRLLPVLPGALVVYDPEPHAEVRSAWRSYRAVLTAGVATEATHLLVVQDDTRPHPATQVCARRIAAARPQRLVSLYHGGFPTMGAINTVRAAEYGERYAEGDTGQWFPCVALVWPRRLAQACLAGTPDGTRQEHSADDAVLAQWLRSRRTTPLVAVPNLVEHPDDVPSLVGCKTGQAYRRSVAPVPAGLDPLLLRWG